MRTMTRLIYCAHRGWMRRAECDRCTEPLLCRALCHRPADVILCRRRALPAAALLFASFPRTQVASSNPDLATTLYVFVSCFPVSRGRLTTLRMSCDVIKRYQRLAVGRKYASRRKRETGTQMEASWRRGGKICGSDGGMSPSYTCLASRRRHSTSRVCRE